MARLRRAVPSLAALATFEAAARLGGFTAAARDLGVTQAAVSRQIRLLEDDLRAPLFVRLHRRVELTAAGRVLAEAVGQSFERIADALEVIRQPGAPDALTLGATLAFSHFWLLPRLPRFRLENPSIALRVVTQDAPFDLREGGCDVVLRYGRPPFADGVSAASAADEIAPICSPDFLEAQGGAVAPERLAALPLIGVEAADPSWTTWRQWFAAAGVRGARDRAALRFSHYSDAVYAAMAGEGVALGWTRLLARPLSDGRLARACAFGLTPPAAYHLVRPADARPSAARERLAAWLAEELST